MYRSSDGGVEGVVKSAAKIENDHMVFEDAFKRRGCRTKKLVRSSFSAQKVTAGLRKARLLV